MSFESWCYFSNREPDRKESKPPHSPIPLLFGGEDSDTDMQGKVRLDLLGSTGNDDFNLLANSSVSRWL